LIKARQDTPKLYTIHSTEKRNGAQSWQPILNVLCWHPYCTVLLRTSYTKTYLQIIRGRLCTQYGNAKRHFPNKVTQFHTYFFKKSKRTFEITFLKRDPNFPLQEQKRNETKLAEGCSYEESRCVCKGDFRSFHGGIIPCQVNQIFNIQIPE
jgi:hypothetical protein